MFERAGDGCGGDGGRSIVYNGVLDMTTFEHFGLGYYSFRSILSGYLTVFLADRGHYDIYVSKCRWQKHLYLSTYVISQ